MGVRQADVKPNKNWKFGVDNTNPLGSDETRGTLSEALNCDLVDEDLVTKRSGYTEFGAAWGSRVIRGGFQYKKEDGTKEIIIYGEDTTLTGSSGIVGIADGISAPTTLVSGLKDGVKPVFIQKDFRLFFFNGQDDFVYDGTTTRQIGISAPQIAPIFSGFTDGELNTVGSYLYAYSYRNSVTGAESSLSPFSASIATPDDVTQDGIIINIQPGDSALADEIVVYRTVAGGSVLYVDGTTTIASNSYTSTVRDAGLGQEAELDNSRPFGASEFAIDNEERLFVIDGDNANRIRYSKIGITGPLPESFQADDFVDCNPNDGDKIVGLGIANKTTIVVKERSVGRLIPIQANVGGVLERRGSKKYVYREISRNCSGTAHHTIINIDNFCVWLGRDDLYATDGLQLLRFGNRILKTIKSLNFDQDHKFSVANRTESQQIIWSVCRFGETEPDYQLIGHYRNLPILAFTFYSPGTNISTHPGVIAASLFEVNASNSRRICFGNSSGNGKLYILGVGNSDDTSGIFFDTRTRWETGRNAASQKLFHSAYLFAAGNGDSYNIDFTFEEDGLEVVTKTASVSLSDSGGATWSNVDWNAFNWASVAFKPIRFFPHKRAYFGRVGFHNYNADEPVVVKGMTTLLQHSPIHR